jgi:hypothetical protein
MAPPWAVFAPVIDLFTGDLVGLFVPESASPARNRREGTRSEKERSCFFFVGHGVGPRRAFYGARDEAEMAVRVRRLSTLAVAALSYRNAAREVKIHIEPGSTRRT